VGKHYTLADPNEIRADRRCRPIRGAADPNRLAAQNACICAPQHVIAMAAPTEHIGGSARVAPGQGTLRSVTRSAPSL